MEALPYTQLDRLEQDFAMRGLVILSPDDLGVPAQLHGRVYERELKAHKARERISPGSVPEVLELLGAPGLVGALDRLVGRNWAIVPFTHNASFTSGARDQHWHKDDNGPFNGRKQRHHQAVQVEMLYYPQAVKPDMGPTATVPFSQYWTFNHEENHDNFAGADHLDFAYQISGMESRPASGPDSVYDPEDIRLARTEHDKRMRDAVTNTGWPLVRQLEAAPLEAGSVVIYSHNTFHRGNHRRDDWHTWDDHPRFMWRFWLYRTTEPDGAPGSAEPQWGTSDALSGTDLADAGDDVTTVWRYHDHWLRCGQPPPPAEQTARLSAQARRTESERLYEQLLSPGEDAEPQRIGAAYRLAALGDTQLATEALGNAMRVERESVRRAATYGLTALGDEATPVLLQAAQSPVKWIRKAGVYGLGDASELSTMVLQTVSQRLAEDPSVYVRSVAAGSIGCLARRAIGTGRGVDLIPDCANALVDSLGRETNRLAVDRAQGRSIKFTRPTDECDVCEGGGVDLGYERFAPVRSAVRENTLWSLVIICSHGAKVLGDAAEPVVETLRQIMAEDDNLFDVGFAMDALHRLARLHDESALPTLGKDLPVLLGQLPVRAWESLVRCGLDIGKPADFGDIEASH